MGQSVRLGAQAHGRMMSLQLTLSLHDGWHPGVLFLIRKRRMPKRYGTIMQGRLRRESERRATPPWADRAKIRALYKTARRLTKETGEQHDVDHIVPLLHPLVCGLHVDWNMEVMHWRFNSEKGNLYWPDMPNIQLELL